MKPSKINHSDLCRKSQCVHYSSGTQCKSEAARDLQHGWLCPFHFVVVHKVNLGEGK